MRSVRLTLAYDGRDFSGWQAQPQRRTVQAVLEQAISQITGESLRVVAAGRTDAGVHALGQAVSLVTASRL
ncbi:MAG: tRNA pseudouridine(38-40) synthase TruA, partial [Pirellulaceae bacterium]